MRVFFVMVAFLGGSAAIQMTASQPVLAQEKPASVKWEYGTLTIPVGLKGTPPPGRYTWTTGTDDIAGDNWKDLAEKLKVELKDKDAPTSKVRILVLNHLGRQGWELVSHSEPPIQNYTFKRRVP